ncbi:GNAT family N-acetyltransferase [Actinoplanes sp. NPDC023714]|uniref:GNAT family N-acetyltransferase n=1 Tax=Actinoplanes sp. NPDC023714 TaxID=3154322 RepID=UPI0033D44474
MQIVPVTADFPGVAALFDDYRAHYGHPYDPERTRAWLAEQLTTGRLEMAAATRDGTLHGLITSAVQPASLLLGVLVHVQDLFVKPDSRRAGVAHALLDHVIARAKTAGAVRVSLRTEDDNEAALALYTARGFTRVPGLTALSLRL